MVKNRWMTFFLLTGFVLAVAMISSIPLYTTGILQKMLIQDLEQYQAERNIFPGYYNVKANFQYFDKNEKIESYKNLRFNVSDKLIPEIPLPILTLSQEVFINNYSAVREVMRDNPPSNAGLISLRTRPEMMDHIKITHGRMFHNDMNDDTIEVVVTEGFLKRNGYLLNDKLYMNPEDGEPFEYLEIVGIFEPSDFQDTYWRRHNINERAYMSFQLFEQEFVEKNINLLFSVEWEMALDYHEITIKDMGNIMEVFESHYDLARSYRNLLSIDFESENILQQYSLREKQLRTTLWIIQVPVMLLLFFYIFMISNLIISNEKNEIAVYKSRGKSSRQVFWMYLTEAGILSLFALLIGPPLGYFICKFMGASNGFLEFVRRSPIDIQLSLKSYIYSLITLVFLVGTMMIPAWLSTRKSIVQVKQEKARDYGKPVWQKFFLDILLLLISAYGFYQYFSRQRILRQTGASAIDIAIDPLLFLTSTFFILGAGLLFLRFFPLLIKLVYSLGSKNWSPRMYSAMLQVSRTGKDGQFIMLFLIFSIAIGIFDANMARTLNRNIEDKTRYSVGADIILEQEWVKDQKTEIDINAGFGEVAEEYVIATNYREPPFSLFTELEGVEQATKVFKTDTGRISFNNEVVNSTEIMGIIPYEFGEIAWFRNRLLPYHWFNYLNLLSEAPNAVLVSSNLKDVLKLEEGDSIQISWGSQDYTTGVIYAFVDFWPTFNPYSGETQEQYLVVSNLDYLHNKMAKEPYQVWIKKTEGLSDAEFYATLEEKVDNILSLESMSQQLISRKNDPMLKGLNGALTQGFILIMIICTIGFLIYWILSIHSRTLQFGIYRAIGLSRRDILSIIGLEHVMMSGASILMGILVGGLASNLFVPFLQLVFSSVEQVPPFMVIARRSDYMKIYTIIVIMLGIGFFLLSYFIKRLKIGTALKLGED